MSDGPTGERQRLTPGDTAVFDQARAVSLDGAEQDLIARILMGDPLAERLFYEAHVTWVYRMTYKLTRDTTLAQDCVQEIFIRTFTHLGQFKGDAPLYAWLRRVVISVVLNQLRRHKTRRSVEVDGDAVLWERIADDRRRSGCGAVDLSPPVARALEALPRGYRDVVVLHDLYDQTHAVIAARLGITVTASKVRLCRAHAKLRLALGGCFEWLLDG